MRVCPNYNNTFKGMNSGVFMGIPFKDAGLSRRKDIKDGEESIPFKDAGLYKRKDREIKPYAPVERTRCAFYGFIRVFGSMIDTKRNHCGFKAGLYSSCYRKKVGEEPDWSGCVFNAEEYEWRMDGISKKTRVYPKEFRPGKARWEGIPLEIWMDYIDKIHKE